MKKAIILTLFLALILTVTGCSNQSVSRSKAKDNVETTKTADGTGTTTLDGTNETGTNVVKNILSVTNPTQGEDYTTASNWNVIRGTVPTTTASIEVNGYKLRKYIAGSQEWNYIAATQMKTLKEGLNEYIVKAFDKEGNVIDDLTYKLTYQNGYVLPHVGTGLNLILMISLFASSLIFFRRKTNQ